MKDPHDLTGDQIKAWKSLERAVAKCKNSNIYFYQVLDILMPLNGDVVAYVSEEGDDVVEASFRSVELVCSFADDTHHVTYK